MPVAFGLSITLSDLMKGNCPIYMVQDAMNISFDCVCKCVWEGVGVYESGLCTMG